ncbi:MAG: hypothetical protein ACTSRI_10270 [Promethearchaeota archaeon]
MKKILSIVDEINVLNTNSVPKLLEQPNNLLEMIETFENEKNANIKKIDSNSDEIETLKKKISLNNREIEKITENNEELTKNRKVLLDKLQVLHKELKETEEKINTKKEDYEQRSQRLEELNERVQELNAIQVKFEEKILENETQLQNDLDKKENFVKNFENRVQAMKSLIKKEYIHSTQYQLVRALQKDTAIDLKNVILALDIKENQAKKIINDIINEKGPIEYDESAGTIILKEEVDF